MKMNQLNQVSSTPPQTLPSRSAVSAEVPEASSSASAGATTATASSSSSSSGGGGGGGGGCALAQDEFGIQLPFPYKLHKMLELAEERKYDDIISWLPNGLAFRVHKRDELIKATIPGFFKQTKYKSFLRQLNTWGFVRIVGGAYYNENFRRDHLELCHLLTRRIPKNNKSPSSSRTVIGGQAGSVASSLMNHKMLLVPLQPKESTQRGLNLLNGLADSSYSSSASNRSTTSSDPTPSGRNPFLMPRVASASASTPPTVATSFPWKNASSIKTIIEDDLFGGLSKSHANRSSSSGVGGGGSSSEDACGGSGSGGLCESHESKSAQWITSVTDPCGDGSNTTTASPPVSPTSTRRSQVVVPSVLSGTFDMMQGKYKSVMAPPPSMSTSSSSCTPVVVESLDSTGSSNNLGFVDELSSSVHDLLSSMEPRTIEAMTCNPGNNYCYSNNNNNNNSNNASNSPEVLFQDEDLARVFRQFRYLDGNTSNGMFVL